MTPAVVSVPASSRVMISSCACSSDMPVPCSSTAASIAASEPADSPASSADPPRAARARSRATMSSATACTRRNERSKRRLPGVGSRSRARIGSRALRPTPASSSGSARMTSSAASSDPDMDRVIRRIASIRRSSAASTSLSSQRASRKRSICGVIATACTREAERSKVGRSSRLLRRCLAPREVPIPSPIRRLSASNWKPLSYSAASVTRTRRSSPGPDTTYAGTGPSRTRAIGAARAASASRANGSRSSAGACPSRGQAPGTRGAESSIGRPAPPHTGAGSAI